ncbi:MAG: pantoate--beta-alanine ligase [Deltaproteobacteria bacterium]|nr:pantoate--beta-alanine ligase [Deltaproteobacteria bacterium]
MRTIEQVSAMQAWSHEVRGRARVALVPTMGALHAGHLSLVEIARRHADKVVASVFVNPTQFDRADDFARYPCDLERDGGLLATAGVDLLFAPQASDMYPVGAQTTVTVEQLAEPLCGAHRPGYFRGVATVVLKLFLAVRPHVAVFGEKDYQQLALIRRMVRDLHLEIDVVGAPIVREEDGLAMSSRNRHLDAAERAAATCLARALAVAEERVAAGERDAAALVAAATAELGREPRARIEYAAVVHPETLSPLARLCDRDSSAAAPASDVADRALLALAVWIGGTRLIDNRLLTVPAASRERRSA